MKERNDRHEGTQPSKYIQKLFLKENPYKTAEIVHQDPINLFRILEDKNTQSSFV